MARSKIHLVDTLDLSPFDRLLVQGTLAKVPRAEHSREAKLCRRLNDGFSSARVYEAEWLQHEPGRQRLLILKLDTCGRLANEVAFSERFYGEAPSFLKVVAASFKEGVAEEERGCIVYEHALENFPGPCTSLTERFSQGFLQGGPSFDEACRKVREALDLVQHQLQKAPPEKWSGTAHRDYWLRRFQPWIEVEVRHVEVGESSLRLFLMDVDEADEISLGIGNAPEVGQVVSFWANELHLSSEGIWIGDRALGYSRIRGIEPRILRAGLAGLVPEIIAVKGRVIGRGDDIYRDRLEAAGLDELDGVKVAGADSANPLTGLYSRMAAWAGRNPAPTYVFAHGDLHGGNVLCVGGALGIIDHAFSGDEQPLFADAARLIGTLWRTAIAPQLDPRQLDEAATRAFGPAGTPAEDDLVERAASFLREALQAAVGSTQGREDLRRELLIDLHNFAWAGLKWPGKPLEHRALALLAALSAREIERETVALTRRAQFASLVPRSHEPRELAEQLPALLAGVVELLRGSDPDVRWSLRELLHGQQQLLREELDLEGGSDGGLLSRLLDKAMTGAWSDVDRQDLQSMRLRLSVPDRQVLADILFFASLRQPQPDELTILLDLLDDGDEDVEWEAAMVLALLLAQGNVGIVIDEAPRLEARLQRALERTTVETIMRSTEQSRFHPGLERIFKTSPEDPAIWDLRPFSVTELSIDQQASTDPELWQLLARSASLSEAEKRWIARHIPGLSSDKKTALLEILREEKRKWTELNRPLEIWVAGRLSSLKALAQKFREPLGHATLEQRLLAFERSFAEHFSDAARSALENARLRAKCLEHRQCSLPELDQALAVFEKAERLGTLGGSDLYRWASLCLIATTLSEEASVKRGYHEKACLHLSKAAQVQPENANSFFAWGWHLGQLASLSVKEPEVCRAYHENACKNYREAVRLDPTSFKAHFNLGVQLDELAQLSTDEAIRDLHGEACRSFEAAARMQPDSSRAFHLWGSQLTKLADLSSVDASVERAYREQACSRFAEAIRIHPEASQSLYSRSSQLLYLVRLAGSEAEIQGYLEEATQHLLEAARLQNVPVTRLYNYACVLAVRGDRQAALSSLEECLSEGRLDSNFVRKDLDWQSFRDDPAWLALLERYPVAAALEETKEG